MWLSYLIYNIILARSYGWSSHCLHDKIIWQLEVLFERFSLKPFKEWWEGTNKVSIGKIHYPFGLIKLCRICQSGRFDWGRFSPGGGQIGHWGRFDNSVSEFLCGLGRADSGPLACPSGLANGLARSQNRP